MKINEVEQLVGITRRNIRFYEAEGLLTPARNSQNGYREYGEEELIQLKRIKLLRKLGLPLEEIRRMQSGQSTVPDGMRRHLITLERESRNLEQAMELCRRMKEREARLDALDAEAWLAEMERQERSGTTFQNKQKGDMKTIRYVAPVAIAVGATVLMAALIALMLWSFLAKPEEAPPLPLLGVLLAIPAVVILGVLLALIQRIREIGKGEEDDAKQY